MVPTTLPGTDLEVADLKAALRRWCTCEPPEMALPKCSVCQAAGTDQLWLYRLLFARRIGPKLWAGEFVTEDRRA